jgi:hypothetical protein
VSRTLVACFAASAALIVAGAAFAWDGALMCGSMAIGTLIAFVLSDLGDDHGEPPPRAEEPPDDDNGHYFPLLR